MPKDEFDFDDPMELSGVGLMTTEDTTEPMAECFIEEFMRLGHNHKQILALFRNPHYLGMNMVLQKRGEDFVCDKIAEIFLQRGKIISWPEKICATDEHLSPPQQTTELDASACDPMGAAIPKLT